MTSAVKLRGRSTLPVDEAAPTNLEDLPLALTVTEAAAVLRVSRSSAYEAIDRGELPAVRIGRRLRVPRYALARMLGIDDEDGDRSSQEGAASLHVVEGASDSATEGSSGDTS